MEKLRIGISRCLIGERVRYDGGHKLQPALIETLGPYVEWVDVCPEVEVGMGTPREPLVLRMDESRVRMLTASTGIDYTDTMNSYSKSKVLELTSYGIDGYVLKSGSPSCGLDVPVVGDGDLANGLYSHSLRQILPMLPVEQVSDLADPLVLANFGESIIAHSRMRHFFGARRSLGELAMFHSQHHLQLIAHSPAKHAALLAIVEGSKDRSRREVFAEYAPLLMQTIRTHSTVDGHIGALCIAASWLPEFPDSGAERIEDAINRFAAGEVSLAEPLTMLAATARDTDAPRLVGQTYLKADEAELSLRGLI